MRSLFLRFFLSFWLIIGVTIGTAAIAGFWYAERVRDAIEDFETGFGDYTLQASETLRTAGRDGLKTWLEETQQEIPLRLFIFDERGHEILDRNPPYDARRLYRRFREHDRARRRFHEDDDDEHGRVRHFRPLPQIVSSQGEVYTIVALPARITHAAGTIVDARFLLLILALIISGVVSWALAKAIARPVNKLRDATVALADGDLSTRVANSVGQRRDELGMLGRDFDSMAAKLQKSVLQQTELSRNISHELRSPLARMRVAIELAKRDAGDVPELDRLELEAERLDSLIGQILSYTRLESGADLQQSEIDLADVVNEVAENVNFECQSRELGGVSVRVDTDELPRVSGYRDALVSAIENVSRNAIYHSPAERRSHHPFAG